MRSLFITLAFSLVATIATASTKDVVEKDGVKYTIHKIAKGETLYSLAQQYSITLDELFAVASPATKKVIQEAIDQSNQQPVAPNAPVEKTERSCPTCGQKQSATRSCCWSCGQRF